MISYAHAVRAELDRFEALRRVLGHAATLAPDLVNDLFAEAGIADGDLMGEQQIATLLAAYAEALRYARRAATYEMLPAPVLPTVDLADLDVRHETCSGNTRIRFDPAARPGEMVGGWRDDEAPELGPAAWHAARALLGRTEWSGGGGPLALRIATEELARRGVDPAVIEAARKEGFWDMPDRDEALAARLEAAAAAVAAAS